MSKIIIGLSLVAQLYAQSYEELLEQAVNNNINLQLIQNKQEQISLSGEIERRYKNPNLELEIADFSSQFFTKSNSFGGRVGISQAILLPHIKKDKEVITHTQIEVAQKQYKLEKSNFIYNFNMKYLAYKKAQKLAKLQSQSVALSSEILETVTQRYQEGAVAKSDYLEASLEYNKTKNKKENLLFKVAKAKNELFVFANISNQRSIESEHLFLPSQKNLSHPSIELSHAKNQVSQAKIELLKHSIDSVELFSELESEPNQDVFRVGVSITLPIFNSNRQERQLEKINIANQKLFSQNKESILMLQVEQLKSENIQLEKLKENYQSRIISQEQLFEMYKQSYTIAKVNLLKLQQTKKRRIQNQEKILETNFAIEQNIIKTNYLQGAYSE